MRKENSVKLITFLEKVKELIYKRESLIFVNYIFAIYFVDPDSHVNFLREVQEFLKNDTKSLVTENIIRNLLRQIRFITHSLKEVRFFLLFLSY
jgi:hypothetical protein